eukprot:gene12037-8290_t
MASCCGGTCCSSREWPPTVSGRMTWPMICFSLFFSVSKIIHSISALLPAVSHHVSVIPPSYHPSHTTLTMMCDPADCYFKQRLDYAVELLPRIAASTNIYKKEPTTQDIEKDPIIGPMVTIPTDILKEWDITRREALAKYINVYIPHLLTEVRFSMHKEFYDLMECAATAQQAAGDTEVPKTGMLHYIKDMGLKVLSISPNSRSSDPPAFNLLFPEQETEEYLYPGQIVLLVLRLSHLKKILRQLASDEVPPLWNELGGFPQLCYVTTTKKNDAKVVVYEPLCEPPYPPIDFKKAMEVVANSGSSGHSRAFPLMSLHKYGNELHALEAAGKTPFRDLLCHPSGAAPAAQELRHALDTHLDSSAIMQHVTASLCRSVKLNEGQTRAVASCLYFIRPDWDCQGDVAPLQRYRPTQGAAPSPLMIIEGPPGTGKTHTIGALLLSIQEHLPPSRVLVCAASNAAVDEVLLRFLTLLNATPEAKDDMLRRNKLLRIGNRTRMRQEVLDYTPPVFIDFIAGPRESKKPYVPRRKKQPYLKAAAIIFSTLGSLSQLEGQKFDVVIVDEASQATEPDVVQALALASNKCVLVGDSKQLQPTVLCHRSARKGMERSLLLHKLQCGFPSLLLRMQYRMHPDICRFPSAYVYEGKLVTAESVLERQNISVVGKKLGAAMRFLFNDVPSGRMQRCESGSVYNMSEAQELVRYMRSLRQQLGLSVAEFNKYCGIITFYRAQCSAIRGLLTYEERETLTVATVDSYQGREMDIILVSCVRAPMPGRPGLPNLGFLTNIGRVNVALTRARDLCVVFGHQQTLKNAKPVVGKKAEDQINEDPTMLKHMILSWREAMKEWEGKADAACARVGGRRGAANGLVAGEWIKGDNHNCTQYERRTAAVCLFCAALLELFPLPFLSLSLFLVQPTGSAAGVGIITTAGSSTRLRRAYTQIEGEHDSMDTAPNSGMDPSASSGVSAPYRNTEVEALINSLNRKEDQFIFAKPVVATHPYLAEAYTRACPERCDLSTAARHAAGGKYSADPMLLSLRADVKLMVDNCIRFNGRDSRLGLIAQRFDAFAQQAIDEFIIRHAPTLPVDILPPNPTGNDLAVLVDRLRRPEDQGAFEGDVTAAFPDLKARYLAVCPNVMFIDRMREKAVSGAYQSSSNVLWGRSVAESLAPLRDDVELIVSNCIAFNASNPMWLKLAQSFRRHAHKVLDDFVLERVPALRGTITGVKVFTSADKTAAPKPAAGGTRPREAGARKAVRWEADGDPHPPVAAVEAKAEGRCDAAPALRRAAVQPPLAIPPRVRRRLVADHVARDQLEPRLVGATCRSAALYAGGEGSPDGTVLLRHEHSTAALLDAFIATVEGVFHQQRRGGGAVVDNAFRHSREEEQVSRDVVCTLRQQFNRLFMAALLYEREAVGVRAFAAARCVADWSSPDDESVERSRHGDGAPALSRCGATVDWAAVAHYTYLIRLAVQMPQITALCCCSAKDNDATPALTLPSAASTLVSHVCRVMEELLEFSERYEDLLLAQDAHRPLFTLFDSGSRKRFVGHKTLLSLSLSLYGSYDSADVMHGTPPIIPTPLTSLSTDLFILAIYMSNQISVKRKQLLQASSVAFSLIAKNGIPPPSAVVPPTVEASFSLAVMVRIAAVRQAVEAHVGRRKKAQVRCWWNAACGSQHTRDAAAHDAEEMEVDLFCVRVALQTLPTASAESAIDAELEHLPLWHTVFCQSWDAGVRALAEHLALLQRSAVTDGAANHIGPVAPLVAATVHWVRRSFGVDAHSLPREAPQLLDAWRDAEVAAAELQTSFTAQPPAGVAPGLLLLLLLAPDLAVQQWARERLLRAIAAGPTGGPVDPLEYLRWLHRFAAEMATAIAHITSTPMGGDKAGVLLGLAAAHLFLLLSQVEQRAAHWAGLLPPDCVAAAPPPANLSALQLLMGRMIFWWVAQSTSRTGARQAAAPLNALLRADTTVTPTLCHDARRIILKVFINSISDAAAKQQRVWATALWELAAAVHPPPSTGSVPARPLSLAHCGCVEWMLKALWRYVKTYGRITAAADAARQAVVTTLNACSRAAPSEPGHGPLAPTQALRHIYLLFSTLLEAVEAMASSSALFHLLSEDAETVELLVMCVLLVDRNACGAEMLHILFRVDLGVRSAGHTEAPLGHTWTLLPSLLQQVHHRRLGEPLLLAVLASVLEWVRDPLDALWLLFDAQGIPTAPTSGGVAPHRLSMLHCLDKLVELFEGPLARLAVAEVDPQDAALRRVLTMAMAMHTAAAERQEALVYRFSTALVRALAPQGGPHLATLREEALQWSWSLVISQPALRRGGAAFLALGNAAVDQLGRDQGRHWLRLLPAATRARGADSAVLWWLAAVISDVAPVSLREQTQLCEAICDLPPMEAPAEPEAEARGQTCPQAYDLYRHLLCSLLRQAALRSPQSVIPALLHVAGTMPAGRAAADASLHTYLRHRLPALLQATEEAKSGSQGDLLERYAPSWLKAAVTEAKATRAAAVAEARRQREALQAAEEALSVQQEMRQLAATIRREVIQPAAPASIASIARTAPLPGTMEPPSAVDEVTAVSSRSRSTDSSSSTDSTDSLQELLMARKKRKADIVAGGEFSNILYASSSAPGPRLLRPEDIGGSGVSRSRPAASLPAVQQQRVEKNQLQVRRTYNRQLQLDHEALLKRIAAAAGLLDPNPSTDDISAGGLPAVPQDFLEGGTDSLSRLDSENRYVNTFVPHVCVELRYAVSRGVWSLAEEARKAADGRSRQANTSALPGIAKAAATARCASMTPSDPLDPAAIRFTLQFTDSSGDTLPSAAAGFTSGDVVLVLLPMAQVAAAIRKRSAHQAAAGAPTPAAGPGQPATTTAIPSLWALLGGLVQVCIVDVSERRGATLRTYPTSGDGAPVSFLHALQLGFTGKPSTLLVFPLLSLRQYLFTIKALLHVTTSSFRSLLCHPSGAAPVAQELRHALDTHLDSSAVMQHVTASLCRSVKLNEGQTRAVASCLYFIRPDWDCQGDVAPLQRYRPTQGAAPSPLMIIEGPPGTGKTQTIGMLLLNLTRYLRPMQRVLVCAPSNCAVDAILIRLLHLDTKEGGRRPPISSRCVRVGVREKVDEDVLQHPDPLYIEDVLQKRHTAQGVAPASTGFGGGDAAKRSLLSSTQMIFSTLGSLSQLEGQKFDVVIVDEASQATEPDVVQALALAWNKCVLVGDSKQLQPTVLCPEAARKGMERSLLTRLLQCGFPSLLLRMQYRMHPDICRFPSAYVYEGKLVTAESVLERQKSAAIPRALAIWKRFFFVDVAHGVMRQTDAVSVANAEEAQELVRYMRSLRQQLGLSVPEFNKYCGIITFYRAQCSAIRGLLTYEERETLTVATVDSYQGREMDIILVSCVRAPMPGRPGLPNLGFLTDIGRVNVALTRARDLCVVFGHQQTLMSGGRNGTDASLSTNEDPAMLKHMIIAALQPSRQGVVLAMSITTTLLLSE